jgi:hypothetical protein
MNGKIHYYDLLLSIYYIDSCNVKQRWDNDKELNPANGI